MSGTDTVFGRYDNQNNLLNDNKFNTSCSVSNYLVAQDLTPVKAGK